jgi:hypothetical protein
MIRRLTVAVLAVAATTAAAQSTTAPVYDQDHGLAGTKAYDKGLSIAYCPKHVKPPATTSNASHAGWPRDQCQKLDEHGGAGAKHTLVGLNGLHNYLLSGYGNNTIIGGDAGDVLWADYHPSGKPSSQSVTIHAGNGKNFIYANVAHNQVWTGTDAQTVVHANLGGTSGDIYCQAPGVTVYLGLRSSRLFHLHGGCHAVVS